MLKLDDLCVFIRLWAFGGFMKDVLSVGYCTVLYCKTVCDD